MKCLTAGTSTEGAVVGAAIVVTGTGRVALTGPRPVIGRATPALTGVTVVQEIGATVAVVEARRVALARSVLVHADLSAPVHTRVRGLAERMRIFKWRTFSLIDERATVGGVLTAREARTGPRNAAPEGDQNGDLHPRILFFHSNMQIISWRQFINYETCFK